MKFTQTSLMGFAAIAVAILTLAAVVSAVVLSYKGVPAGEAWGMAMAGVGALAHKLMSSKHSPDSTNT